MLFSIKRLVLEFSLKVVTVKMKSKLGLAIHELLAWNSIGVNSVLRAREEG